MLIKLKPDPQMDIIPLMAGLLADGWFYISSAGLLVSGVLFFFLLSQYRAAGEAADQPEAEAAAEPQAAPVRRVYIPEEPTPSPKLASVPADKPAEKPAAAPAPASAPADKRREVTTGGVNPAVVYLQNIKNQLEELHAETRDLAKRVEAITGRDEALIDRLSELAQAVAELKSNAPAPAPSEAPAPKRAKKAETAPAAEPVAKIEAAIVEPPEPVAEPVAAPVTPPTLAIEPTTVSGVPAAFAEPKPEAEPKKEISPDETVRIDPKAKADEPLVPAELFTPAAEEPDSGEKPRRGPVWPV